MTSVELIEIAAERLRLKKPIVAMVISTFFEEMSKALESGEPVKLRGYGSIYPVDLKPMSYFGGKRVVGPRVAIRFKVSRRSRWKNTVSLSKKRG